MVILIKVQKAVLFYVHFLWRSRDFFKGCLAAILDCFHGNRCSKNNIYNYTFLNLQCKVFQMTLNTKSWFDKEKNQFALPSWSDLLCRRCRLMREPVHTVSHTVTPSHTHTPHTYKGHVPPHHSNAPHSLTGQIPLQVTQTRWPSRSILHCWPVHLAHSYLLPLNNLFTKKSTSW